MTNNPIASTVKDDLARAFLDSLYGISENTRNAYSAGLKLAIESKLSIDNHMLQTYAKFLTRRKFAKATKQLYITALRRFIDWLDATDQLSPTFNRAKAEAKMRAERSTTRSGYKFRQPDPDLAKIITYYDDSANDNDLSGLSEIGRLERFRARAIMHTLYASAGRVSEIANLTRAQVADGRASEVMIVGKGDKQRMLLLTSEAQKAIQQYCELRKDSSPALFVSHRKGKNSAHPITRASVWNLVKVAAKALGLSKTTSPHSFRHYRATQLLNEGMPLESVQAYLGHSSPETTRIVYAHTYVSVLRDQLNEYGLSPKKALENKNRGELLDAMTNLS
jgi:site-specific recombinase XerD